MKSDYHDWRGSGYTEDRLDKPGWLEQWLTMHNLPYLMCWQLSPVNLR